MVNFRKFISNAGTLILAGKNAENNEKLIEQVEKDEEVFHTSLAGSPFVNIKGKPKKGDIKEAAIFCARYSRDWKKNKKNVEVHRFKGKDIYKEKEMKKGTFGIKKKKIIIVKKEDIKTMLIK
jgi:predicted ribosome quality control (RQC) complex YloA/Tae2 family protein